MAFTRHDLISVVNKEEDDKKAAEATKSKGLMQPGDKAANMDSFDPTQQKGENANVLDGKQVQQIQNAASASTAPVVDGLDSVGEGIAEGAASTEKAIAGLQEQGKQYNASSLRALYALQAGQLRIQTTLSEIYAMMAQDRGRPELQIYKRKDLGLNMQSKNGNADREGAGGGLLDGLLGAGVAAYLATKAKGLWDKFRGARTAPTTGGTSGATPRPSPTDPNRPNRPNQAPRTAPTPHNPPPATPAKGATVWDKAKGAAKGAGDAASDAFGKVKGGGGRLALLGAAGAAVYAGGSYLMNKKDEAVERSDSLGRMSVEEIEMQNARRASGMAPLDGDDLREFRKSVTNSKGWIANPETGFPLNEYQMRAVQAGIATPAQAIATDNTVLYKALQDYERTGNKGDLTQDINLKGVSETPAAKAAGETPGSDLLTNVAVFGGGAYVAHKGYEHIMRPKAPPPVSVPPTPAGGPVSAPSTIARPTPPATLASVASAPSAQELTKIKSALEAAQPPAVKAAAAPYASVAANDAPDSAKGKAPASIAKPSKLGKALPVIGTAVTAYDAYSIWNDQEATTKEKLGKTADLAGGTAGAILGAKAGAAGGAAVGAAIGAFFFGAGAVPGAAIGAAIGGIGGGIAGYMGGESITRNAREWLFGDDTGEGGTVDPSVVGPASASPAAVDANGMPIDGTSPVVAQTEKAFNQIVDASSPMQNPDVSRFMKPGAFGGTPVVGNTGGSAAAANNSSFSMIPKQYQNNVAPTVSAPSPATASASSMGNISIGTQPSTSAAPSFISGAQQPTAPAVSNFNAKAVNEQEPVRNQYSTIKTVVPLVPETKKPRERSTDVAKQNLSGTSLSSTGNRITTVTKIDDVPSALNEAGLGFANGGII